ncbi:hypothetical protein [Agreia pratensis]|uniref:Uncharacterized protein n=1 Tax=Agreia pratensis TaxID=150121 RepID=A0A1X7JBV5_9MICO|nr:hypothetical protein [Agreia pratensis]SMG24986.1 hypothetical protein SAMN06296010_1214 [Agreia pratensis]
MDQNQWLGDLPTWITAGAVIFAALQFLADKKLRMTEEARESKAQATGLTAWTVSDITKTPKPLGAVVSNTSGSTFHDIELTVQFGGRQTDRPIRLEILPPGRYFIAYDPHGQFLWKFPVGVEHYDGKLQPYMNAAGFQIVSMRFADNLNQRWSTDAHAVLTSAQ